jgi:hypothetical protein
LSRGEITVFYDVTPYILEAADFSEMFGPFDRSAPRHIPEDFFFIDLYLIFVGIEV